MALTLSSLSLGGRGSYPTLNPALTYDPRPPKNKQVCNVIPTNLRYIHIDLCPFSMIVRRNKCIFVRDSKITAGAEKIGHWTPTHVRVHHKIIAYNTKHFLLMRMMFVCNAVFQTGTEYTRLHCCTNRSPQTRKSVGSGDIVIAQNYIFSVQKLEFLGLEILIFRILKPRTVGKKSTL